MTEPVQGEKGLEQITHYTQAAVEGTYKGQSQVTGSVQEEKGQDQGTQGSSGRNTKTEQGAVQKEKGLWCTRVQEGQRKDRSMEPGVWESLRGKGT